MSTEFEIRYLKAAEKDLYEILDYITNENPQGAESFLEKIDESIGYLAANPFLGRIPRDERLRNLGYRMLIVEKYLVFYVVKEKTIQVRRIIHGSRRYDFLL